MYNQEKGDKFLRAVAIRHQYNEALIVNAKIDLSYETRKCIKGMRKLSINPETINHIETALTIQQDFALVNPEGGYIYFIDKQVIVSWNENDHSNDSLTKIEGEKALIDAISISVLGHQRFVSLNQLKNDQTYITLAKSWYGNTLHNSQNNTIY